MKRLILFLVLASIATPLFANDSEGDGVTIPPIGELIREGYGPVLEEREERYSLTLGGPTMMAKPTQAFHDDLRHRTIYYGFRPVMVGRAGANLQYAFGYPLEFFKNLLPPTVDQTSLDTLAVAVYDTTPQPHHQAAVSRHDAVTTVKPTP